MTVSSKVRLYALAKELKLDVHRLIEEVRRHGVKVSVPSNSVSRELADRIRHAHAPHIKRSTAETGRLLKTIASQSPTAVIQPTPMVHIQRLYKREWKGPLEPTNDKRPEEEIVNRVNPISAFPGDPSSKTKSLDLESRNKANTCQTCGMAHVSRKALRSHVLKVHGLRLSGKTIRPLRLVYIPVQTSNSPTKSPRITHKRICQVCALECVSKAALRTHIVSEHLAQVLDGKLLGKVKVSELSAALSVEQRQIKMTLKQIGITLTTANSLPAHLLKELVNRIRLTFPEASAPHNPMQTVQMIGPTLPVKIPTEQACAVNLSPEILDQVLRMDFGELRRLIDDCLKDRLVPTEQRSLFTTDSSQLRDYAQILAVKVSGPSDGPAHKIVRRILWDIEIFERRGGGLGATKINWKILPPGEHPFQRIVEHFQHISKRRRDLIVDMNRLHRVFSLSPERVFVGIDEFEGYVVFYFASAETAVLDCPVFGNAIYIFGENWKSLSRLTKSQLLSGRRPNVERIIHSGAWFSRLRSLVAARRLRASLHHKSL